MPGFNRRGPDNQGPMTGWGRGVCTGNSGYDAGYGQGYGRRWGRRGAPGGAAGRGMGRRAFAPAAPESPDELKQRAGWLESELAAIRQQLNE
ncbi:MAG: DUF5320 domain-containing protein [Desulfotignum sp.]